MPLASVDESGTQFYYEDSGAPPSLPNYRTLILIHGGIFNGATYGPMFPYAAKYGMRIVTLNMRDYRGSTPYSPSDLEAFASEDPKKQQSWLRARGSEIAAFLVGFIREENIPPPSYPRDYDTAGGGLSLLAWSWGNVMSMSFLAQASDMPEPNRSLLGAYLRSLLIYDPSRHAFGVPPEVMEGLYSPTRDPNISDAEKAAAFKRWVSGYYAHSPSTLAAFPSVTLDKLREGISHHPVVNPAPTQVASTDRMSPDELAKVTDSARAHPLFHVIAPSVYRKNLRSALWDACIWPKLKVSLIWCDMSPGETLLASWYLARELKEEWPEGGRKVELIRFEGANHFPHWDQPDRTMQLLTRIVGN